MLITQAQGIDQADIAWAAHRDEAHGVRAFAQQCVRHVEACRRRRLIGERQSADGAAVEFDPDAVRLIGRALQSDFQRCRRRRAAVDACQRQRLIDRVVDDRAEEILAVAVAQRGEVQRAVAPFDGRQEAAARRRIAGARHLRDALACRRADQQPVSALTGVGIIHARAVELDARQRAVLVGRDVDRLLAPVNEEL